MTYDPTPSAALVAEWQAILVSLLGDGYSTDLDGQFRKELEATAYVYAWSDNVLTNAGLEVYAQHASELLDEHEREYQLPNDSGITDEERQERIIAIRALRGLTDASVGRVLAALGSSGFGEYRGVQASEMALEGSLDVWHALGAVLVVGEADYLVPRVRQTLALALERGSDTSRLGTDHSSGIHLLATAIGALWTSTVAYDGNPQTIGRVAIDRTSNAAPDATTRWISRLRSFGPLSVLTMSDLRRVTRSLCLQPGANLSTFGPSMAGDLKCLGSYSIAAGTNILVEDSRDWRIRFLVACGQCSTSDIRPGGAAEDGDTGRFSVKFLDTFAGGVGTVIALIANVELYADGGGAGLRVRNIGGSTVYLNLFVWASSPYNGGTVGIRDPFGLEGDSVQSLTAATWNTFVEGLPTLRGAAAAPWNSGEIRGLIHRTAMTPPFRVPSTSTPLEYVIDSSVDWRDRFIIATLGGWENTGKVVMPGSYDQDVGVRLDDNTLTAIYSPMEFGYLGPGHAAGQAAAGQWDVVGGNMVIWALYANSTTGALTLAIYQFSAPPAFPSTFVISVIGSFQLGVKVSPSAAAPALSAATDSAPMRPAQLNFPQDYAIQDYGRQADLASGDLATIPLGLDTYGVPPIARVDIARRERVTGYAQDAAIPLVRRERTDGGVSCFEYSVFPTLTHTLIDASQDWRDRWVWHVGFAGPNTAQSRGFYSGPGTTGASIVANLTNNYGINISNSPVRAYVDQDTGYLWAYNAGVQQTHEAIYVGSPRLGGRSVYVRGYQSDRQPIALVSPYIWLTGKRVVLTQSNVRRASIDVSRNGRMLAATQFNGFQGSSPAVGFQGVGGSVGSTFSWINGSHAYPHPALRILSSRQLEWETTFTPASYDFLHAGTMTLVLVFRGLMDLPRAGPDVVADRWFLMGRTQENPNPGIRYFLNADTGQFRYSVYDVGNGDTQWTSKSNVWDGRTHWVVLRRAGTRFEMYIDGFLEDFSDNTAVGVGGSASIQWKIGAISVYLVDGYSDKGYATTAYDLHEIIAYNVTISDAQLAQLHNYLKNTHSEVTP